MKQAAVIIVTYGQWPLTERCLTSLTEALGEKLNDGWEIVVVDNNSPDQTREQLREWSDTVRIELLPENRNFAGGCNRGAEVTDARVLVFLNSDTEVPAGALERLVDQVNEPGVAAAGCRLLFPSGAVQHAGVAFWRDERFGGAAMPLHVFFGEDSDVSATSGVYEADTVTGACLAVRRDAFMAVGGFDETYRNGFEDTDLCFKLRSQDHKVVLRGDVTITHHEGASRDARRPSERAAARAHDLDTHNTSVFLGRWGGLLEQDDALALTVWDGTLRRHAPPRAPEPVADVLVIGQPSGIGPGAEEARALIAALHSCAIPTAAFDIHPNVVARPTGLQQSALDSALRKTPKATAAKLYVAAGRGVEYHDPSHQVRPSPGSLLRLARADHVLELDGLQRVLVPCAAVASGLAADGLPQARVSVVPPPMESRALQPGGQGILVILPVQHPALTRTIIEQLRPVVTSTQIRVLPTVFNRDLARDLPNELPGAELLGPCSDEERFAALAGTADVVIAADPADSFERRALVAAGVGTRPLTIRRDGPASEVLGVGAVTAADTLRLAVAEAMTEGQRRERWQALVRSHCDPAQVVDAVSSLCALA